MRLLRFPRSFGARLILACALGVLVVAGVCAFSPVRAADAPKTLRDVWVIIPPVSAELPPGDPA